MQQGKYAVICAVLLGSGFWVSQGIAEEPNSAAEVAAIRAGSQAFTGAFNAGDAKAVAALWTADGDYIDETGRSFAGRAEIEQNYARFFAENPGVRLRIVIDSLRLLSSDAAIEDGRTILETAAQGAPATGKYTAVHVKIDGKWLMSTVRDSRIETPSTYRNVADLEWLIGDWAAEEHGQKFASTCRWIANKSFVERKYRVTHADGTVLSGLQLIGWNPQAGHVQSWNFSSDGGHAIGVWSALPDGWSAEVRGMTGEGTPTEAVVQLQRLDDKAYVWKSVGRSAGGQPLPDTEEIVLKRQPAK